MGDNLASPICDANRLQRLDSQLRQVLLTEDATATVEVLDDRVRWVACIERGAALTRDLPQSCRERGLAKALPGALPICLDERTERHGAVAELGDGLLETWIHG